MLPRVKAIPFMTQLEWFCTAGNVGMPVLARETRIEVLEHLLQPSADLDAIMAKMDTNNEMVLLKAVLRVWQRAQARCTSIYPYEYDVNNILKISREDILACLPEF
jgi:hypothetical protein